MAGIRGLRAAALRPRFRWDERMLQGYHATRTPLPRVLAVHVGEHGRQITCAGDRLGRHRLRDAREVSGRERYVERAERFLELIAAARADQRHDVLAARAPPGEGE